MENFIPSAPPPSGLCFNSGSHVLVHVCTNDKSCTQHVHPCPIWHYVRRHRHVIDLPHMTHATRSHQPNARTSPQMSDLNTPRSPPTCCSAVTYPRHIPHQRSAHRTSMHARSGRTCPPALPPRTNGKLHSQMLWLDNVVQLCQSCATTLDPITRLHRAIVRAWRRLRSPTNHHASSSAPSPRYLTVTDSESERSGQRCPDRDCTLDFTTYRVPDTLTAHCSPSHARTVDLRPTHLETRSVPDERSRHSLAHVATCAWTTLSRRRTTSHD